MRADARGAEDPLPQTLEPLTRVLDVLDFVADMVLPPGGVLGEETGQSRLLAQRLDQFDLRAVGAVFARRIDEADFHALLLESEGLMRDRRAHDIAVIAQRFLDRGRRDADMVETAEFHFFNPIILFRPHMPAFASAPFDYPNQSLLFKFFEIRALCVFERDRLLF